MWNRKIELEIMSVRDVPIVDPAAIDHVAVAGACVCDGVAIERMAQPAPQRIDDDDVAGSGVKVLRPGRRSKAEAAEFDAADP